MSTGEAVKAVGLAVLVAGCGPTHLDAVDLAPTTLGSGLVAHWTFDDGEGTVLADQSGNRRDGVVTGGTFANDGRFGGALRFAPGDTVTVENFPYATANWTFSAWMRVDADDTPPDGFGNAVNTEILGQGGWEFQTVVRPSGLVWTFAYWIGPNLTYAYYDCPCLDGGAWSHATVVVSADAGLLSFYVDGKLAESKPLPASILPGTSTLYMGKWEGAERLFSGSLDDIAIYSRALSAAEVSELHERPPPHPR